MRAIHVTVTDSRPHAPAAEGGRASFLKQNFSSILGVLATCIAGIMSYFFVTSVSQQLELSRLALERQTKLETIALDRARLAMQARKADLDAFKDSVGNAAALKEYIPQILDTDAAKVQKASITLAVAGPSNTSILVAALANPMQYNADRVVLGLQIVAASGGRSHTCDALCNFADQLDTKPENYTSIGNLALAMGELKCDGVKDRLSRWKGRFANGNVDKALARIQDERPSGRPCGTSM